MSNKKEYAIGETVQMGLVTLVCEEAEYPCDGCYFLQSILDCEMLCEEDERTDNKDVIFKLKEE